MNIYAAVFSLFSQNFVYSWFFTQSLIQSFIHLFSGCFALVFLNSLTIISRAAFIWIHHFDVEELNKIWSVAEVVLVLTYFVPSEQSNLEESAIHAEVLASVFLKLTIQLRAAVTLLGMLGARGWILEQTDFFAKISTLNFTPSLATKCAGTKWCKISFFSFSHEGFTGDAGKANFL